LERPYTIRSLFAICSFQKYPAACVIEPTSSTAVIGWRVDRYGYHVIKTADRFAVAGSCGMRPRQRSETGHTIHDNSSVFGRGPSVDPQFDIPDALPGVWTRLERPGATPCRSSQARAGKPAGFRNGLSSLQSQAAHAECIPPQFLHQNDTLFSRRAEQVAIAVPFCFRQPPVLRVIFTRPRCGSSVAPILFPYRRRYDFPR